MVVGIHFKVIVGYTMRVGGLFMEENLAERIQEKARFCFHWVCFGRGASGNKMW